MRCNERSERGPTRIVGFWRRLFRLDYLVCPKTHPPRAERKQEKNETARSHLDLVVYGVHDWEMRALIDSSAAEMTCALLQMVSSNSDGAICCRKHAEFLEDAR
jgi:hypothetical protein